MPGNSFPLTYRAKVYGESHGESLIEDVPLHTT